MKHYYRIESSLPVEREKAETEFASDVRARREDGPREILEMVDGSLLVMTPSEDERIYLEMSYTFEQGLDLLTRFYHFCETNKLEPRNPHTKALIRNAVDLFYDYKWSKAFRLRFLQHN